MKAENCHGPECNLAAIRESDRANALQVERDAAVKRAESAEAERVKMECEWEVMATKDLDCEFDRMKRQEAEAEVERLREVLVSVCDGVEEVAQEIDCHDVEDNVKRQVEGIHAHVAAAREAVRK